MSEGSALVKPAAGAIVDAIQLQLDIMRLAGKRLYSLCREHGRSSQDPTPPRGVAAPSPEAGHPAQPPAPPHFAILTTCHLAISKGCHFGISKEVPISLPQIAPRYEDAFCDSDKVRKCENADLRYHRDNAEQVRKMRIFGEYAKTRIDVRRKETVRRKRIAATVASPPSPPAPPLSKIALQSSSDSLS